MRPLLVGIGGAIGRGLRYVMSGVVIQWLGPGFPYGTLAVKVLGSVLIGLIQEVGTTSLLN